MTDTTTRDAAKEQFSQNLHAAIDRLDQVPTRRARTLWVSKEFSVSYEAARKWLSGVAIPDQTHIAIIAKRLKVDPAQLQFGRPDQGCQCATCHRARLDEAAPALLDALERLVALAQVASVEKLVIAADHPAVLNACSALLRVQT